MYSETSVTNGELLGFNGQSSDGIYAGEFGTQQAFTSAQGLNIYLDNKYVDNKKGYGEVTCFRRFVFDPPKKESLPSPSISRGGH
jgi:hypothetical protein